MSFDIHGLAATDSADETAGVLVLRFASPATATRVDELASQLRDAGVLEGETSAASAGRLAAMPWRVPAPAELGAQKNALAKLTGVAEAWAFSNNAEADLGDWFAPRWRVAPPTATASWGDTPLPERISWEGFGLALGFATDLDDASREVVKALAELWLSAYADRGAQGALGSSCYRRAVIAPHGARGVVVGVEGLANPGTDAEAIGYALWLAEQIGRVLSLESVSFLSLLPQAGESGETIEPAVVLQRATREWSTDAAKVAAAPNPKESARAAADTIKPDDSRRAPETLSPEAAAAATDEVETVTADAIAEEFDDEAWAVETVHLPRADEALAAAIAARAPNGHSQNVEVALVDPDATIDGDDLEALGDLADELETLAGSSDAAMISAIESEDSSAIAVAFDAAIDKPSAAAMLAEVIAAYDATDWDDIEHILKLAPRAISANPESSSAHMQLIGALCRVGRGAEAIELGLANLDRAEVLFETFERLCVFRREGETAPLLPILAASGHEGVGDHYYNLGCKLHASSPAIAIALYRGAIACGSPRPQADINAGLALMTLGRHDEAGELTTQALDACGDEPNLWANLIDVQTRLEAPELGESIARAVQVLENFEDDEVDAPAASQHGWGALVADLAEALILGGRAAEAIELIDASSGDDPITARVNAVKARALAITGDLGAASELLDHVETADATAAAYYRARAVTLFLAGETDRGVGNACAVAAVDPALFAMMRRDPIGDAIDGLTPGPSGSPPRPPQVPAEATWDASSREWEHGPRDAAGEKHGSFRYYRADGTLCNECTLEAGKPQGGFLRFHESGAVSQRGGFEGGELSGTRVWFASDTTTSEQMHTDELSVAIRRSEMDYVTGRVVAVRHFDGDGVQCSPNGEPLPDRPGTVSAEAFYRADEEEWFAGEVDEAGRRRGIWRRWDTSGVLLEEIEFSAGERNGAYRAFFADGTLSAEGQYEADEKQGTFVFQRRGGAEHDDFPVAARSVTVAEESHDTEIAGVRYYDKTGREVTIDGTPLEEWTVIHPELESWFNELWQVPWPELDDASGNAHRVPHLLVGLLANEDDVLDFVYHALAWHLDHEGVVYSGTAAAIPFLVRLAQAPGVPQLARLCNFIRHAACYGADALKEAAEQGAHAVVSTNDALMKRMGAFVDLLGHEDESVRAAAGAVLAGSIDDADEMSSHLSGAFANEKSEMVCASHMFSLARFGTAESLFVVEAQLGGSAKLVATTAAMALVMARGESAGARVADRLVASLLGMNEEMVLAYSQSPWADDHLVTEIAQALHYACPGNGALERLVDVFDKVDSSEGVAVVAAALAIGSAGGEGLTEEVCAVLRAIADSEALWAHADALAEVLGGYELPTDPDELRELADQ